jgi:predicted lipoprotein with Yx(FWY)xxD motif
MLSLKRTFQITLLLSMILIVAACGSNSSTTTGSGSSTGANTTTSPPILKSATMMVNGASDTVLTNAQGMTLYYLKSDTATKTACTGTCAGLWPPLLFTGTGSPTSATTLPGTLTVFSDANGQQVEYNGHQLYTYSGDTAPGQTNGEGFKGVWFVATSSLSGQSAPTPKPYGY